MKRLSWWHHQIKDLSFLAGILDEPTFSSVDDDEEGGDREEGNQKIL